MKVKYEGKFKDDLSEYINDQPWMFELDANNQSFWELPISMQWGVILEFSFVKGFDFDIEVYQPEVSTTKEALLTNIRNEIMKFQKFYNKEW